MKKAGRQEPIFPVFMFSLLNHAFLRQCEGRHGEKISKVSGNARPHPSPLLQVRRNRLEPVLKTNDGIEPNHHSQIQERRDGSPLPGGEDSGEGGRPNQLPSLVVFLTRGGLRRTKKTFRLNEENRKAGTVCSRFLAFLVECEKQKDHGVFSAPPSFPWAVSINSRMRRASALACP